MVVLQASVGFVYFCWFRFEILRFVLSSLSKKDNRTQRKTKMQNKATSFQLAQLCSQTVFLILGGGLTRCTCFAENTKDSGFSIFRKRHKRPKMSNESKSGPRLSQKLVQACCAT